MGVYKCIVHVYDAYLHVACRGEWLCTCGGQEYTECPALELSTLFP